MARKPQKDRTSLLIAAVLHVLVIGGVVYWAYKTGKIEQMRQAVLQYVRSDKKNPAPEAKAVQQKAQPSSKLPPINQGMAPQASSGTRRAVAADAPAAEGESFFQDTRKQVDGASTGTSATPKREEVRQQGAGPRLSTGKEKSKAILPTAGPSNVKALLQERSKAAAAIESFGAEQISKTSVSDAGDIVARVSGATVVDGKYAVIRGLTDRYSAATLNGAELPSADPYRRSAALDMFPAKIIDKVVVTKTFTPDQPGSFTGGNINIVSKSFPERSFASFEVSASYNTQTTGNDKFLSYRGGGTDWLGMDDGTRALADEFWESDLKIPSYISAMSRPMNLNTPRGQQNAENAAELDRLTKLAGPADFAPRRTEAPPGQGFVAAAGGTAYFLGRPVGLFLSVPYSHTYQYQPTGTVMRVSYQANTNELSVEKIYSEEKGTEEVNWAATASVTYQILPDHQLGYTFLFNQYSEDSARIRRGSDFDNDLTGLVLNRLQFIERNLTSHQFRGNHAFPELAGFRTDWLATFTDTYQDEPDTRFYNVNGGQFNVSGLEPKFPTRFWRYLEENNRNLKVDFVLPFLLHSTHEGEIKWGLFEAKAERSYKERILQYNVPATYTGDPNDFLTDGSLGSGTPVTNGNSVTYYWSNFIQAPSDQSYYSGKSELPAAYAMADIPLGSRLRLIGGGRFERTDIRTSSYTTVPSEGVTPGETNTPPPLQQDDLLPAAGLVLELKRDMALRLNYGETVARPSFRELAGVRTYDPILDEFIVGNPKLKMSAIQNYDLRWEWFPRPGELFSVGVFMKQLQNVIEKEFISGTGDIITFVNRPEAEVYGIEFEGRKSLDLLGYHLRRWSLGGNLSLIESEQDVSKLQKDNHTRPDLLGDTRPLADQSPYILNLDLTYDNTASGTTLSFGFNVSGPRLTIANLSAPDIYEQPVPQFDIMVSQRIGRHWRLKFSARNLLDPEIKRTYGEDEEAIYSSYKRGQTFSVSLSGEF